MTLRYSRTPGASLPDEAGDSVGHDGVGTAAFSGYQRLVLPDGTVVPGVDRSGVADKVFPADLSGQSVLDVGCYYGYFLHEAVRRGARRAVGLEPDLERYELASRLAPLWDGAVEVIRGTVGDVELNERFDLVLLLNVLHHVPDPVALMRGLRRLSAGVVVVEFRELHDPQLVRDAVHGQLAAHGNRRSARRLLDRVRTEAESRLVERVLARHSLVGVGSFEYDRTYYFTRAAFERVFVTHTGIFSSVEFVQSTSRSQTLAICRGDPAASGPSHG